MTLFGKSYLALRVLEQFTNEDAERVDWGTYVHAAGQVTAEAATQRLTLAAVETIGSAKEKNTNFPILKRVGA